MDDIIEKAIDRVIDAASEAATKTPVQDVASEIMIELALLAVAQQALMERMVQLIGQLDGRTITLLEAEDTPVEATALNVDGESLLVRIHRTGRSNDIRKMSIHSFAARGAGDTELGRQLRGW